MFVFLIPADALVDDTSLGAQILEAVANLVSSLLTTPFIAAVVTLTYFDLRVRKEGFDLAVLAERMGGAPATGTFAAPAAGDAPDAGGERDAFGNPVVLAPTPAPPPARSQPLGWATPPEGSAAPPGWTPPPAPAPDPSAAEAAPPGWAPPVPPEPQRPPSRDE